MTPTGRHPMTAKDLFAVALVGDPQMSPDGTWIAYCVREGLVEDNRYRSSLYLVPAEGGPVRRLTYADASDDMPRWSPDGRTLAFVSDRHEKRQQIHLLPMDGGEARRLTDVDGSIGSLAWSPDGTRLVMGYRPLSEEEKARREAEKKDEAKKRPAYKVHTDLHFKEDGAGFLFGTHQHLYVVDAATGKTQQITDGEVDDIQPRFSPDGRRVVFASNRLDEPLLNLDNHDICTVSADGGPVTRLTTTYGPHYGPVFSPDGKSVAFVGHDCEKGGEYWNDFHLWTVPADGGEPRDLTPDLGRPAGNWFISDTRDVGDALAPPVWSPDGRSLTFTLSDSGSVQICRVSAEGGPVTRLTPPGHELDGLTTGRDGRRLAFVIADHLRPAEVAVMDAAGGEPQILTDHNRALLDSVRVGEPEEFWVDTAPGARVQGWILKPPEFTEGKKYPLILEIHGGPFMAYGNTFFHEMQFLAARGYVVVWTNPRGSQSYGEAHTRALVHKWGIPDTDDLMIVLDEIVSRGYVDETRLGVTGGSYGGFMTNWLLGHTDRFKAGVTQRSVVDMLSFYGASDYGHVFEWEFGLRPWDDEESMMRYLRMSPIHRATDITAPLLIIHSEEDHRCPVSQAEELFTTLKRLGRTVEFVRFEGESHGLSRGGRPQNRLVRLERIAGWFDDHL